MHSSTTSFEDAFASFTNTEYYSSLKCVLRQRVTVFVPSYSPELRDVRAEVVEQRRKWIAMLTANDAKAVNAELRARW